MIMDKFGVSISETIKLRFSVKKKAGPNEGMGFRISNL
jgi:hypothetical protein